jgi:alkylation response protein AidB-like acyl-CoA dehydrogenase
LIDGTRAADLTLDNLELDELDIVARGEIAAILIEDAQARVTVAALAAAVGSMEACLELCSEYLKVRTQFGQPIGKFQVLQHTMADMLVEAHNARSMLYYALSKFDLGRSVRQAAISAAKLIIGQAGLMVSSSGIQLHGGYGLTDEFAIGHHHRFLCRIEKCHGDTHAHVKLLGDLVLAGHDVSPISQSQAPSCAQADLRSTEAGV